MKRTTRAQTLTDHRPPSPFTLLTLAWLPMHVPTQIATLGPFRQLENAYEGTINSKKK